jgi:hypothetical protein
MRGLSLAVLVAVLVAGWATVTGASRASGSDPGALVRTTAQSTIGVVLDEIPPSMRSRVAEALIARPASFWTDRAKVQLHLTSYRLVFRQYFYDAPKGELPLPPDAVWNIKLVAQPTRRRVQGHDVVAVDYRFSSVLLTDAASPGKSEPRLADAGGTWREPFNFPIDPELVMQRTGYACMDESDFPFNSVDSEEVDSFYDQTAEVEKKLSNQDQAHYTRQPSESCLAALKHHIGRIDTSVRYERLPWNQRTADRYRVGTVTGNDPDLKIYDPEFGPSRITYRYVPQASCEVAEDSVGGTGWRRLLQFATSDENVGNQPLRIGHLDYSVTSKPGELDAHNLFQFSACHHHYHFNYYGDFTWRGADAAVDSKKGFCLQSTARVANREGSPIFQPFDTCHYQGVAAGWLDEYKAGLPSQWLDITTFRPGTGERSFTSNPNGFICEGKFVNGKGEPLGPNDKLVWAATGLTAANGKPVEAPLCQQSPDFNGNNHDSVTETIPPQGQGLITTTCTRGQIGPLRNCGFGATPSTVACAPGQPTTATFALPPDAPPQVVRITEFSHTLDSPIPARYEDSWVPLSPGVSDQPYMLANTTVTASAPKTVTFTCPGPRTGGDPEPGGVFSIYSGPVFPDDPAVALTKT